LKQSDWRGDQQQADCLCFGVCCCNLLAERVVFLLFIVCASLDTQWLANTRFVLVQPRREQTMIAVVRRARNEEKMPKNSMAK
jgi:hypothetical protein